MNEQQANPSFYYGSAQPGRGLVRSRLHNFGLTMVVMGASFILYYLGLFGTVEGPLTPANMGTALSGMGVTRFHVILFLALILVGAAIWNWALNLIYFAMGCRLTCKATGNGAKSACGATVKRTRRVSRRSGKTMVEYVCTHGHRRPDAHFHPIKKGTSSHVIWLACLAFLLIAIFSA